MASSDVVLGSDIEEVDQVITAPSQTSARSPPPSLSRSSRNPSESVVPESSQETPSKPWVQVPLLKGNKSDWERLNIAPDEIIGEATIDGQRYLYASFDGIAHKVRSHHSICSLALIDSPSIHIRSRKTSGSTPSTAIVREPRCGASFCDALF